MTDNLLADKDNFKILRTIWKNAYDKSLEIKVKNRRLLNEAKNQILKDEKKKIEAKYEKIYSDQYTNSKIANSEHIKKENLKKMTKRSDLLKELIGSAEEKIKNFANSQSQEYRNLLKKLILQGMVKLLEPVLKIRVRLQDRDIVQRMFSDCEKEYVDLMKKETGRDYECKLELDSRDLENECGGVLLFNSDFKIQCGNTLDSRLYLASEQLLPQIKQKLFK